MTEPGPSGQAGVPQDAQTLGEVLTALETEGFGRQLVAREGGRLRLAGTTTEVDASEVRVVSVRRLEGASDPDDEVLVAAVELPTGERGALVLSYGPHGSAADGDVLLALDLPH